MFPSVKAVFDRVRWTRLLHRASYGLLPGQCLLCGIASGRGQDLCTDCQAALPFNWPACSRCGLPLTTPTVCGRCLVSPPAFHHCIAPLRYTYPVDRLVNSFKHRGQFNRGTLLAELLVSAILTSQNNPESALPDLLAPVPLHWRRQFTRGFNQAGWLSRYLGRKLAIPVDQQLLHRHRHTPHQQGQSRKARLTNIRGAFQLHAPVNGKHIGLVDDVMTTGTTVGELSDLLMSAGAVRVDVWCLARTPLEN
ncbi:ComF family protein [uncultured Porticoccus sp.]|uniref:ComF family protein n=1 Tax=uncultured Porticoccus sp. TaxID=1256050 RepID=UPI0030DCB7BF|tara:strand:+ start:5822 stop:6574 length:753 start_codon:yes stop_codon:yes gene_type:complete